jgi:SPP1 family phage portal protein
MNLEQLQKLIDDGDIETMIAALRTQKVVTDVQKYLKQYDPKQHKIFDESARPDTPIEEEDESDPTKSKIVGYEKVARQPLAYQKKIVLTQAAFLGKPVMDAAPDDGKQKEQDLMTILQKIQDDNKMEYKFKKNAKIVLSERECAEIWFTKDAEEGYWDGWPIKANKQKFSVKLLAYSLGDELFPVFDEFDDMIAFGRQYELTDMEGEQEKFFDLYTAETFYFWMQVDGKWGPVEKDAVVKNPFKKIPVIYYCVPLTAWDDVQELIEALETIVSDHRDTNDYNGHPIIFAEGQVEGFAHKGEKGKVLIGKNGAKVSYLTWNSAPESIKLEIENLMNFIHTLTHTPDVSFDNLKGLGYFSTIALQTLFMDAHMKAADNEEVFGEGFQRRINYLKNAIGIWDTSFKEALRMPIKAKFEYFLPKNIMETIDMLVKAKQAGIISTETAVRQIPFVVDPETEVDAIKTEAVVLPPPINQPGSGSPAPAK